MAEISAPLSCIFFSFPLYLEDSISWTLKLPKAECFPLANEDCFQKWTMFFFFFLIQLSPLENTSDCVRRKRSRTDFLLCLTPNILLKLRAAPSANVNICANRQAAGCNFKTSSTYAFYSARLFEIQVFSIPRPSKEEEGSSHQKTHFRKSTGYVAGNWLLIS